MNKSQLLKVGIAGHGVVGKRREAALARDGRFQLIAVCDRYYAEPATRADGVRCYSNYHQLLDEELDVLLVCVTNDIAAEVTIAGLEKGLHVFCEKPPGRNLDDIARVILAERKNPGLKLKYGFNHRYHQSIKEARQLVKRGELGRIVSMRGVYGKSNIITFNQSDWRTKRAVAGGGVLLDQGIHMVDLMRLFGGEFKNVHSFVENSFWNFDVEDNAYALMRNDEGVVALLHSSATQWRHVFSLEVHLELGAIILSGILSGSKSYGAETLTVVWSNPREDRGDPKEQQTRFNVDPSWEEEISEFASAIIENQAIVDGSSTDAYRTMELVYKIYCSDPQWQKRYGILDKPSFDFKL